MGLFFDMFHKEKIIGSEETIKLIVDSYIDDYVVETASVYNVTFEIDNTIPIGKILRVRTDK